MLQLNNIISPINRKFRFSRVNKFIRFPIIIHSAGNSRHLPPIMLGMITKRKPKLKYTNSIILCSLVSNPLEALSHRQLLAKAKLTQVFANYYCISVLIVVDHEGPRRDNVVGQSGLQLQKYFYSILTRSCVFLTIQ